MKLFILVYKYFMDSLERLLDDLYSPATLPARISEVQQDLMRRHASFSLYDLNICLQKSSSSSLLFAFQAVIQRPKDFLNAESDLISWYFGYIGDLLVIRNCASALAALQLSHSRIQDDFMDSLSSFLNQDPSKGFILIGALANGISRTIKNDAKENARLFSTKTALTELVHKSLYLINEQNFEHVVSSLVDVILANSNPPTTSITSALFAINDWSLKRVSLLVGFLNACSEWISLADLIKWYVKLFQNREPMLLHLSSILAVFQDKMSEFCLLTERVEICNFILTCLSECSVVGLNDTVGFWEDLAHDLADSDLIETADQDIFKRLLDLALHLDCDKESFQTLMEAVHTVVGNELVVFLAHVYSSTQNVHCIEGLICLGDQFIGPPHPITQLMDAISRSEMTLFLRMFRAYFNTLKRDSEYCERICQFLSNLLCSPNSNAYDTAECLSLYVSFVNENTILMSIRALATCPELSLAKLIAEFCSKACSTREPQFNSQVVEFISQACPRASLLQILPILLSRDAFNFSPRTCPSFCNQVYMSCVDMTHADPEVRELNSSFLTSAVSRAALVDGEFCSSVLSCLSQNVSTSIVPIFVAAENVSHFPECLIILSTLEKVNVFNEDITMLHMAFCRSDIESYMEFGIEKVVQSIESCVSKLAEPVSLQELKTILGFYSALFLEGKKDTDINWRSFLLESTIVPVVDSLISSSYRFSRDMNECAAHFTFNLVTAQPTHFKEYMNYSRFNSRITWMLRERSLREFTSLFQNIFK